MALTAKIPDSLLMMMSGFFGSAVAADRAINDTTNVVLECGPERVRPRYGQTHLNCFLLLILRLTGPLTCGTDLSGDSYATNTERAMFR